MIGDALGVRIEFLLEYKGQLPYLLPYNYKHSLQAVFYNFIKKADSMYADFLHEKGYKVGTKVFKYFVFSNIRIPKGEYEVTPEGLLIYTDKASLYFSSFIDRTMISLVKGTLGEEIILYGQPNVVYDIFTVKILPAPKIKDKMKFVMLSPLALKRRDSSLYLDDYDNNKDEFVFLLKNNLIHKYEGLTGKPFPFRNFSFSFSFLPKNRKSFPPKRVYFSKTENKKIGVRCFEYPFFIEAPKELIEVGYYAGFGVSNAMGFGMVEVVNDRRFSYR